MLRNALVYCFFLLVSFPLFATDYRSDSYDIFIDSNNDEVYLQARERFILIANDINIPLLTKNAPDLVLIPDGSGGYTVQTVDHIPSGVVPADDLDLLIGDFNGDGFQDIFLASHNTSTAANGGVGIALYGTAEDEPSRVEAYTQIQGIVLANAVVEIAQLSNGQQQLLITNSEDDQQFVSADASGFKRDRSVSEGTLVGNTPAEFDVTYGGAASYKIPLATPVGAAGLQPGVSLNYNSQLGNSTMSVGWQLAAGMANIDQCYKRNTNELIYCLNGDELVYIGNDYYRTEIDSGVLVEAVNSTTFKLHYENGGTKTLTRQLSSSDVYLETTYTQRGGASYSVSWSKNTIHRELLLESITYQGNEIQFIYEARNDQRHGYWLGAPRNRTQRLQSVIARADGQLYRQYNVFYEYDNVSSESKVTAIQECATNGECLRPLTFDWTDSGARGTTASQDIEYAIGVYNFDNDGKVDLNTSRSQQSDTDTLKTRYADIDGDGRDDRVTLSRITKYRGNDAQEALLRFSEVNYSSYRT